MLNSTRLFLLLFLVLPTAIPVSAEEKSGPLLQWQPAAGAAGYEIEVETREGEPVTRQRTTTAMIRLALPPGEYRVRIIVLNRFGKAAATGDWSPLAVRRMADAELERLEPAEIPADGTVHTITLHGAHFFPGTTVALEDSAGKTTPLAVVLRSETEAQATLPAGPLAAGRYTLLIENRPGRRIAFPGRLAVLDREVIEAGRLLPAAAFVDEPVELYISGRFPAGCELVLHAAGGEKWSGSTVHRDDGLQASLPSGALPPGSYQAEVRSPRGTRAAIAGRLDLRAAPQALSVSPQTVASFAGTRFILTGSGLGGVERLRLRPSQGTAVFVADRPAATGDTELVFTIPAPAAAAGYYRIELGFNDGLTRTLASGIELRPADSNGSSGPSAGKTPQPPAFKAGIGLLTASAFGDYGTVFAGLSSPGIVLHAAMDLPAIGLGDPRSPDACFGVEFNFDGITLDMSSTAWHPALKLTTLTGIFYWRSSRSGPLALLPGLGIGYAWGTSTRGDSNQTRRSAGTVLQAGVMLEWTPWLGLAIDAGFTLRYSLFPDPLGALCPFLRVGWKF